MSEKKNKLVIVGYTGIAYAFLNTSEEEAIQRYIEIDGITMEQFKEYQVPIEVIEFDDVFQVYAAWEV